MFDRKPTLLVTGGAGFIGSEFVRQAVKEGRYKICIVDSLSYAGDRERLKDIKGKFFFEHENICNKQRIARIFRRLKPSLVVHFAAESHVDRSILSPQEAVQVNVLGTEILLQASRRQGIDKFIHVSTDEVYGEISKGRFLESSPIKPNSPYSASKAAGDLLVGSYIRTYRFPAVIVRPSNNYGPWQYPEKLIPVVIYKALKNERIPVYAKGKNVREWIHVSDCARAVNGVLSKGKLRQIYNIGSENERQNIEVVKKILDLLGKPHRLIQFVQDRPGHDVRYALNSSKIKKELGWRPMINFEEGLAQTVQFYLDHSFWLEKKVKAARGLWKKIYK